MTIGHKGIKSKRRKPKTNCAHGVVWYECPYCVTHPSKPRPDTGTPHPPPEHPPEDPAS